MRRDGVWQAYQAYGIPAEVEADWLRELTAQYLAALDRPGNWKTVYFLDHHSNLDHFDAVAAAEPRGEAWEQCSFLELAMRYAGRCSDREPQESLDRFCRSVVRHADLLAKRAREPRLRERIAKIKAQASCTHGR